MEATLTSDHHFSGSEKRLPAYGDVPGDDPGQYEIRRSSGAEGAVSAGGARYKLMSPAKLPISRSPCITIPPGLSPTSFLESPVLLSDMKVEPSPTTGSFAKPPMTHSSFASSTFSVTKGCSNTNTIDDRNSSFFEFKPHSRSDMVPADLNIQKSQQSMQLEGQCLNQFFPLSPSVKREIAVSTNDLTLSIPDQALTSGACPSAEVDSDEKQKGNTTAGVQASQTDGKASGISVVSERASDDGYNWRKYGQKLVKGSEFPRSYYKCVHPNCEVKKLFERSHDGQITEIIYKGTHDHPKPQPSRRYSAGTIISIQEERPDDKASNIYKQMSNGIESNSTPELSPVAANGDSLEVGGLALNKINDEMGDDDPFSKRRKMDTGSLDITPVVKPIREPRVVVQTLSEVDILDDGYRWRKYGQKVVRGNPNPRSYYKCTNAGCPVRKHVERASHDPKAVITTYEGKHNHDVPTARTSSHDTGGPAAACGLTRIKSEESETISLDLGVGISTAAENRFNGARTMQLPHRGHRQTHTNISDVKVVQKTPVSTYFSVISSGMNPYGSRENTSEGRSIEGRSLNHSSYPYPQNMGRLVMGP